MDLSDLTIFKTDNYKMNKCNNNQTNIIDGCLSLKRLKYALLYYHKFDLINNNNDTHVFANFIIDIYNTNLINDYIHLVDNHSNQIQEINEQLLESFKCDIKTCKYTTRHHNNNNNENDKKNKNDKLLNFYVTTLDSLHFYLLHLFESGLRVKRGENKEKEEEEEEQGEEDIFDFEFSRIYKEISKRRSTRKSFDRFKSNSKFTISTSKQEIISTSTLILDQLFNRLKAIKNISKETISRLKKYIEEQEFDTEALEMDIDIKPNGNIKNHLKNQPTINSICNFFETIKSTNFFVFIYIRLFVFFFLFFLFFVKWIDIQSKEHLFLLVLLFIIGIIIKISQNIHIINTITIIILDIQQNNFILVQNMLILKKNFVNIKILILKLTKV